MSGRLVSAVFESRLTHRLKTVAAALATFGRDDGTSIRPSLNRLAHMCGRSQRRVQAAVSDLQAIGVLVMVRRHGRSRPTEYRLDLDRLAQLDPPPRHQLNLPLFPQVFQQQTSEHAGRIDVFHSFHSRTQDDPDRITGHYRHPIRKDPKRYQYMAASVQKRKASAQ